MFTTDGKPSSAELKQGRENGSWSVSALVIHYKNGFREEEEIIVEGGTLPVRKELKMSKEIAQVGVSQEKESSMSEKIAQVGVSRGLVG